MGWPLSYHHHGYTVRPYAGGTTKAVLRRFKEIQKQAGLPAEVVASLCSDWSQEEIDSLFDVSPAEMEAALGTTAKQVSHMRGILILVSLDCR